jgi:hypothetical protein
MLVTVERSAHHMIGALRAMSVFVDGQSIGMIRRGEKIEHECKGDRAEVWVGMDWCKSKKVTLNCSEANAVSLVCGYEPFLIGLLTSMLTPSNAFSLVRKDELASGSGETSLISLGMKGLGFFNIILAFLFLVPTLTKALFLPRPSILLPFGTLVALACEPIIEVLLVCSGLGVLKRHRIFGFVLSNVTYVAAATYYAANLYSAFFRAWAPMQKFIAVMSFAPGVVFCAIGMFLLNTALRKGFSSKPTQTT